MVKTIKKVDINKLRDLGNVTGTASDGTRFALDSTMYDSKVFSIAIHNVSLTSSQIDTLKSAIEYASQYGINITTTIVKMN